MRNSKRAGQIIGLILLLGTLSLSAWIAWRLTQRLTDQPPAHPIAIKNASAGVIGGRVCDERGGPVAGVTVSLFWVASPSNPSTLRFSATTDAVGNWNSPMPVGRQVNSLALTLAFRNFVTLRLRGQDVPGLETRSAEFTLLDGFTINGTMLDPKGEPAGNTWINISTGKQARTNALGRFSFAHVPPGPASIFSLTGENGWPRQTLNVAGNVTDLTLRAAQGVNVSIAVHDSHGAPVSGARVVILAPTGDTANGVTDAQGLFKHDNLNPASNVITVNRDGYPPIRQAFAPAPSVLVVELNDAR